MFVLYKNTKSSKTGKSYVIAAGNKVNVKRQISELNLPPDVNEILKIKSDIRVINSIKSNKDVLLNFDSVKEKRNKNSENKLMKCILLEFLKCHNCKKENVQVCRDCGQMTKKAEYERIGVIASKTKAIGDLLGIENDWACSKCRLEFSLITWKGEQSTDEKKNYLILISKREDTRNQSTILIKKFENVRTIVNLSPSNADDQISNYIKDKFLFKNIKEINSENETQSKQFIIQSFLNYYYETRKIKKNSIRICKKCAQIFLNASAESIGSSSLNIKELCELLRIESNWTCTKCGDMPSLILCVGSFPANNADNCFEIKYQNTGTPKLQNSQADMVPCLELFTNIVKPAILKKKLREIGDFEIKVNKLKTKLAKRDVVNRILQTFIATISQKTSFFVCNICQHIFNNQNNELGYFWIDRAADLEDRFKSNYTCPFHEMETVLYWNMSGWNTLTKIEENKKSIFMNTDIICLIETHLTPGTDIDLPHFFLRRIAFDISAEKKGSFGRGSGGLLLLVKKTIMCNINRLMFSNKGIFTQIQFKNECFIIGVIYWRPETREESLVDWIDELDNFINVHKTNEIKFILGGDFNARTAQLDAQHAGEKSNLVKTRKSEDKMKNKRGRLLIELMTKHKFILCNGRSKSDNPGRFSSHTVNGDSVVDYIWISKNCNDFVKDMKVIDIESRSAVYHKGLSLHLKKGP